MLFRSEIGRCERALGQALGWRLWVGKTLLSSHTPCSSPPLKQIVRSQSESSIMIHSIPSQFLNQENSTIDKPVSSSQGRGLRSCATLPVDAFVSQRIASSVESSKYVDNQGVIDRITYNRESLSDCPLGHQDCSSSLNDSVCTRYEQSGRTQEWISNSQVFIPLALKGPSSFFFVQPSSSKLPDQACGLQFSPIPVTASPSPETPGLTYSPSTTDSSSEARTVQMMFEDNVGGNLSQPWLGASGSPKPIILSTLSSNCEDGFLSVADAEAGPFETHEGLWYETNQHMIRDPIGTY